MANGHGGFRPGAGRKALEQENYQYSRRKQIQALVTSQDWQDIVRKAVEQAKDGDYVSRAWLTPYVAGKVPEEINARVAQVIEIVYSDSNSADPALPPPSSSSPALDYR